VCEPNRATFRGDFHRSVGEPAEGSLTHITPMMQRRWPTHANRKPNHRDRGGASKGAPGRHPRDDARATLSLPGEQTAAARGDPGA
jgi:hypothetical protein